jgi:hypothetical protein
LLDKLALRFCHEHIPNPVRPKASAAVQL